MRFAPNNTPTGYREMVEEELYGGWDVPESEVMRLGRRHRSFIRRRQRLEKKPRDVAAEIAERHAIELIPARCMTL